MKVDIPALEQIMCAGIQRDARSEGGRTGADDFALHLRETIERFFPAMDEDEGGSLAGHMLSADKECGEGTPFLGEIPEEVLMEVKSLLGSMSISSPEGQNPGGEMIPVLDEFGNGKAEPSAAEKSIFEGVKDVFVSGKAEDILREAESLKETGKGDIKAEPSSGVKPDSDLKGDALSGKTEFKDILRGAESSNGTGNGEVETKLSAAEKPATDVKGDVLPASETQKETAKGEVDPKSTVPEKPGSEGKTEFKDMLRASDTPKETAKGEAKEGDVKAKPTVAEKPGSDVKSDILSGKTEFKDIFRASDTPKETAKGEAKEGDVKAKPTVAEKPGSDVKSDILSGKTELPGDRPVASRTVINTFSAEKVKNAGMGDGSQTKTPEVFSSDTGGSMNSADSNVASHDQANRFVSFEPEKEALLNLSRFQIADVSGESRANVVSEEVNHSSDRLRNNVMDQVYERLAYFRETGNTPAEMRLTLNPPSLGELIIRVFSRQGKMTAEIITGMSKSKEILETGLTELKQRLQQANIMLERIDVFTAERDSEGNSHFNRENRFFEPTMAGKANYRDEIGGEPEPGDLSIGTGSGGSIDMWA